MGRPGPNGRTPRLPQGDEERSASLRRYAEVHRRSIEDVRAFWEPIARQEITWIRPFTRTLDWELPFARWFPDGELNACDNCLDRHLGTPVEERVAYHWEGDDGERRAITYGGLYREVNRLAGALDARGFSSRDFAAVYLPMIPELPVALLALARLGIPFTTVFSGFSATALSSRVNDLGARLILTADGGRRRGKVVPLKEIVDHALESTPSVTTVVVAERTRLPVPMAPGRDVAWSSLLAEGPGRIPVKPVSSTHPLFLLYSSGTTGAPKAIAHSTGGYQVYATTSAREVFDPGPKDVFFCAADIGWVTGHSYIIFAPLALGLTSVLYEGAFDFPSPSRLWEMCERYGATILYTSPT
ncbi:MAG: AMP-binding protein, partial [Thermoplasmata archaeon]|nr:AMP-binding protein [Thermoplasmata archaeon]